MVEEDVEDDGVAEEDVQEDGEEAQAAPTARGGAPPANPAPGVANHSGSLANRTPGGLAPPCPGGGRPWGEVELRVRGGEFEASSCVLVIVRGGEIEESRVWEAGLVEMERRARAGAGAGVGGWVRDEV